MCVVVVSFRGAEDMQLYSLQCTPLSHDTLENAVQWIWNLDRLAPVSDTACVEALLKALDDHFVSYLGHFILTVELFFIHLYFKKI